MKKKFIALAMAAMCMAGSFNTVAFASRFADINDVPWPGAAQYIDEAASLGLMKGYNENGKFYCKARNNVTYIESVQLAYQIMKSAHPVYQASSAVIAKWTPVMQSAHIPSWAYECISFALENSILTANDIRFFVNANGSQNNARREDVGVIFGKALSKIYKVSATPVLNYNDRAYINASSVPYIELLYRLNLMVGDSANNFNPSAMINRAEMAVLSTKTFKELKGTNPSGPSIGNEQLVGTVTKISSSEITVKTSVSEKTVKLSPSAQVMYDGKDGRISDIKTGDTAIVIVINGTATFLNVYHGDGSYKEEITEGRITSISTTRISIEAGDKKSTYKFDRDYDEIPVKIDGSTRKDVDDLIDMIKDKKEIKVKLSVDKNGYVIKIDAETVDTKSLTGLITSLRSTSITLKNEGKEYKYDLIRDTDDITVTFDGKTSSYDKLKDMYDDDERIVAKVTLNSNKEVIKITAEKESSSNSSSVSGSIYSINDDEIRVRKSDGSKKTIKIDNDVDVTIDGKSSSLRSLIRRVDDDEEFNVRVYLDRNGRATKISASLAESKYMVSGTLESVDERYIKVETDRTLKTIRFATGCQFYIDGSWKSQSEFESQYRNGFIRHKKVVVTLDGAENAKRIEAETGHNNKVDETSGKITYLSSSRIEIELSNGREKEYDIYKRASIKIDGKSADMDDLRKLYRDEKEVHVELTLNSSDEVTRIEAGSVKTSTGYILNINTSGNEYKISISDSKDSKVGKTNTVRKSAIVIYDGDELEDGLKGLEAIVGQAVGRYKAELIKSGNEVVKIIAEKA